jgi:hypothetical protein
MTEDDVRGLLRKATEDAGSRRAWALAHDLSAQYVGDVIDGKRSIGPAILAALNIEAVTTYRKIKRG